MKFTWRGHEFDYFDDPYNTTLLNERAIEVPIAAWFVQDQSGDGLELGNVLGHYGVTGHRVVDLYEHAPGVENIDVFNIGDSYDWIVSISTLEHVQWDSAPRRSDGSARALAHLRSLLRPGGHMFVTVPLGHHPRLDEAIRAGDFEPEQDCVMVLNDDQWEEDTRQAWRPYGKDTDWASAVWIATW